MNYYIPLIERQLILYGIDPERAYKVRQQLKWFSEWSLPYKAYPVMYAEVCEEVLAPKNFTDLRSLIKDASEKDKDQLRPALVREQHAVIRKIMGKIAYEEAVFTDPSGGDPRDDVRWNWNEDYIPYKYAEAYKALKNTYPDHRRVLDRLLTVCRSNDRKSVIFSGYGRNEKISMIKDIAGQLGRPVKFFDMSEYDSEWSLIRLVGTPSDSCIAAEGILTELAEDQPDALMVFEGIEKADPAVRELLFSAARNRKIKNIYTSDDTDLSEAVLIFMADDQSTADVNGDFEKFRQIAFEKDE